MSHLPVLIPITLLFSAFLIPLAGYLRRDFAFAIALIGGCLSAVFSALGLLVVISEGELRYDLGGWAPPIGIEYVLDVLSAFMATVVTLVGSLVLLYSRRSILQEAPERVVPMYALAMLLLAGLSGIIVTADLFNLFVFLEIASLSAYALMAVGDERGPVAAFRYLILGSIAGSFYVLGVGFLYFSTGSLNMADVAQRLPDLYQSRAVVAAVTLIFIALGLKMALFPLHLWLPDVYSYAPSAIAGLIAPIMTKVAAYAIIRMLLTVFQPPYLRDVLPVTSVIAWLAAAGIVYGSIMAIAQSDFRRMLAYSSISQIGYIGLGIGLANPLGLTGALLHILNHAFMKACLFLVAGCIRFRTGQWEVSQFAGLGRKMPWTMAAFTASALSMVGIPPAAGFFSKWYLLLGGIDAGNWIFVATILFSSLLTAVYFFRVLEQVYAAQTKDGSAYKNVSDPPAGMLLPTVVLGAGVLLLGVTNSLIVSGVLRLIVAPLQ
ncbi:MAG TPA: monovalent cation/H+ antiporter subunit D family protein [Candidatus Binatia bacterium]|nr:monovalent cation/H+ antiporter subunit D family protein [Candidatus Binatia bacterium]